MFVSIAVMTAILVINSPAALCDSGTPASGNAVAYQIDAAHSGSQSDGLTSPLIQRWSRNLGDSISYPLIAGGKIFVTVRNQTTYGTKLYALDELTGATSWGPVDLGGTYYWSGITYEAGRVFALNFDGLLRAFDATSGALAWSKQLPGQYAFSSPPTAFGGVVYTGGAGSGGTVYAVAEQDGTVKWTASVANGDDSSPAVSATGVYVSYACNQTWDFSPATGTLIWHHPSSCAGGGGRTPVLFGSRLYARDFVLGNLVLDSNTGSELGSFSSSSPPAFDGSTGYFLSGSTLQARDPASGAVKWSFTGDGTLTSAPIVDNGYVYIGSGSGKLYAIVANTGATAWSGNVGASVLSTESPVTRPHTGLAAGDGLVVVPASNLLLAYEPVQVDATAGTPQSSVINSMFGVQLQATVKASGNPKSGVTVTFTAPSTGPSGTFPGSVRTANVITDVNGVATAPVFTANGISNNATPYNVTASLNDGYTSTNFSLTNLKGDQTINFAAITDRSFGDADFGISATATSGLAVSFSASGNCTVTSPSPAMVHLTGAGACTITASQAGDSNYNAAAAVQRSFNIAKANPSTSVSSSVNPSNLGQSVTFTATVSSGAGTPTGTVQFKDGGANLGSPVTLVSGVAQLATSALTAGIHTITADYSSDANFSPSSGTLSGGQSVLPALSINDVSATEGDSGTKTFTFTVTLSGASNQTVTVNYATADGTATTAGSDYVGASNALMFNPGDLTKTIAVTVNGDQKFEPDETFLVNLSNPVNATISDNQGQGTIVNDDAQGGIISFAQSESTVSEADGAVTIAVNRTGETGFAATVNYATDDTGSPGPCATFNGFASSKCDFTTAIGTLTFAPNETQKTFTVLVNRDSYGEIPYETFAVKLSSLTGDAVLGTPSTTTVRITDSGGPAPNAIDDSAFFVRQHYHDFLHREPDASGLQFWTNEIESCGADAACREVKRINVSAAFFLSIEFQETGYLVERLYMSAYGVAIADSTYPSAHKFAVPIIRLNEFLADSQEIGRGVVVGQPGWEQQIENNKVAFINSFVQRQRFTSIYASVGNAAFVDMLNQNAAFSLSPSERSQLVSDLDNNLKTRAQALRTIAEHPNLVTSEFNRAFVLMQYFGYLRRNPDDPPDHDHTGYDFWLTKLNEFGGNFQHAEMVKAFISSDEYRHRFGP